ncbi:uncharacterized protein IL334_005246 [Kwoniella shivajii]|uniref:K Homology domain-containing protein n=1 Tax=Kwoniella shivajii TaxID=564305 RepID=A0ABZ1D4E2_9TREE|nr:hypothetical protein IL334_005246 [Kwoniella shivajii]
MFPTTSRNRSYRRTVNAAKAYQHESPPTTLDKDNEGQIEGEGEGGGDSCYGVKSVSSWGEQSQSDISPTLSNQDMHKGQDDANNDDDDEEEEEDSSTPEGGDGLVTSQVGLGLGINPPIALASGPIYPESGGSIEKVDINHTTTQPISPSRPIHTRLEQRIIPPSPEDTVHPLDHSPSHPPSSINNAGLHEEMIGYGSSREREHQLTLEHITRSFDTSSSSPSRSPYLQHSEPSSPASFTSMPSYVASLSSLSRTSSISPLGMGDYPHHHHHNHHHLSEDGNEDELVLPTLSLPSESLSLHMSLSKWTESPEGALGVILLGSREEVEKTLRKIREKEHLVEIKGGVVGIVRNGKVQLRIITGLRDAHQVRNRMLHLYNVLNGLLHPQLGDDTNSQTELRRLVEGYVGRSDWVHAVISLENTADTQSLRDLLPTIISVASKPASQVREANDPEYNEEVPYSRRGEVEPTPKPSFEASGYFAPRVQSPSSSSSRDSSPSSNRSAETDQSVNQILQLLDHQNEHSRRSIDSFLSFRCRVRSEAPQDISQEQYIDTTGYEHTGGQRTMTSSMTSASSGVGAMPTVARAQGGGEWEANLSRRIAQRRESETKSKATRERSNNGNNLNLRGRGRAAAGTGLSGQYQKPKRKRSMDKFGSGLSKPNTREGLEKDCLPPLFPTSKSNARSPKSISEKGLGVRGLIERTFKGMRQWRWSPGWKGLLVVSFVVAVGLGCLVSKRTF